jgi:hypothetical protein
VLKIPWIARPLICFLLPSVALAEVRIPSECRVANLPPGRCGWCAVETLARHLHISSLYGITAKHPDSSRPRDLEAALTATGVKYRIQSRGCTDAGILETAISEDLGVVVGFRPWVSGGRGHVVTLVDFNKQRVRILDPNDKTGRARTMDVDAFLERWDGFALVLERPESSGH